MIEVTNHIGVLLVSIFIPQSQSLKDKRMVIKSMKDRIRVKFNVSVSELDNQDKWQTAILGFCMIGNDKRHIDRVLQSILSFIYDFRQAEVCDHSIEFC